MYECIIFENNIFFHWARRRFCNTRLFDTYVCADWNVNTVNAHQCELKMSCEAIVSERIIFECVGPGFLCRCEYACACACVCALRA